MNDDLEKIIKNLDSEAVVALNSTIRKIVLSHQNFHEATTGSMLSEETQRQRKNLLSTSLFAYIVTWAGVFPEKVSWLGIELTDTNASIIYAGLALILMYLFRSFWWRADLEFSNSRIRRKNAALLHDLDAASAINELREINEELADAVHSEFSSELFSSNESDPYRASIMGLNFKSRFFELRLPQIVFIGAVISCTYFMFKVSGA
ncbi:hypothetical protein DOQ08_01546 [Marinobacter litoralis]|uniref:Uncharacterized protein n=1 Tax=Marinobacter litoralis TaxID=187981 RepID=A0A3M2RFZ6_9GAMM|nr:hypothetical protein [Marinobacter litoralis]RMJ04226.1 hypothetical protein DOQ08_01546 [Marinobacter litoralis]